MVFSSKRLKRFVPWLITIGLLVPFLGSCAPEEVITPEVEYVIRFAHGLRPAPTHHVSVTYAMWAEKVEQKSAGRIKVEISPAGQLYRDIEIPNALMTGAIEAGACYSFNLSRFFAEFYPIECPGVIKLGTDPNQQLALYEGEVGRRLFAALEEKGIKGITWAHWGSHPALEGNLSKETPIIIPADCKGHTARAANPAVAGILAELGAHPVYLSGFDPRHAIQNTGIDSIIGEASVLDIVYRKLYEVQDWFVPGPIITAVWTPIMMNKEFFDNLPADLQQIIMEAGEETYQERKYAGDELAEKYLTQLQEEGLINVRVLTPEEMAQWDEIFVPAGRECVKEAGPDAIEIYNMIQDINKDIGLPYQYI